MKSQIKKTDKELRKFGITLGAAFILFGGLLLWRDKQVGLVLMPIAGFFFVFGLLLPRVLMPVEWAWMKVAHTLGFIMTRLLLTLTFYLIISPIGIVMRILGKDQLKLKFDKDAESYWVKVDPGGPTSRADKPY